MRIIDKIYAKFRKLPVDRRVWIRQTSYWVGLYMIVFPMFMIFFMHKIYDMQQESFIRRAIPEEFSDDSFKRWLKKQNSEGRFLDEKTK